jgi:hypothetical protein
VKPIDEGNTRLNEGLERIRPDYLYEGGIPEDNDTLDYIKFQPKGVRVG